MQLPSGFEKYLANASWMVGGRMAKAFLNFIVGIFVARYLGPDRFGALNYSIGIVALFSIFCAMGLDNILVRDMVRDREREPALLGSAFLIRLTGSGAAFFFTILLLWVTESDRETWILTMVCSVSYFFLTADVLRNFFEARVQAKNIIIAEGIQCLLSTLLRIYFIAVKGDVFWFAVCWLSEFIFTGIFLMFFYRLKEGLFSAWRVEPKTLTSLFREGFPLLLSAMAIVVYLQIDKIMLKNMLGITANEQVGWYSAALRFIPFALLIPQMLSKALAPSLIKAQQHDPEKYRKRVQLFFDLMTWIGIGLSLSLMLLAGPLVSMYGDAYSNSVNLLRIVSLNGLFQAMGISSGLWIMIENLQKWVLLRNLAGCMVNIVLNFIFIPRWGAIGASWASVISIFVATFLVHAFIRQFRGMFILQCRSILWGGTNLLKLGYYQIKR